MIHDSPGRVWPHGVLEARAAARSGSAKDGLFAPVAEDVAVEVWVDVLAGVDRAVVPGGHQARQAIGGCRVVRVPLLDLAGTIDPGSLVDTAALTGSCATGRLDAVLEVTDPDPLPPDHPLLHLPSVLVTPHLAGSQGP